MKRFLCWLFRHPSKTDVTFAGLDRVGHVTCWCGEIDAYWRDCNWVRLARDGGRR